MPGLCNILVDVLLECCLCSDCLMLEHKDELLNIALVGHLVCQANHKLRDQCMQYSLQNKTHTTLL